MATMCIALGALVGYLIAYHTYGRWLARRIFRLDAKALVPSVALNDDVDYVPTHRAVVFGHHFTSIAGTGPIVGPAIAVMWGWLPALLWVLLGSIFIGAMHDLGALVISLRNRGQTVGDIAGRVLNPRVRLLFLFILFLALTIVIAIFGLVIAAVFRQYPAAIFPCLVQAPIAVGIGIWLHRRGVKLLMPSVLALGLMYLTVVFGDTNTPVAQIPWLPAPLAAAIGSIENALHQANAWMAGWSNFTWVLVWLGYSYVASVLPVWLLLQPRDYINSLQLISVLGLIVVGLVVAAILGGPPVAGTRQPLELAAPMVQWAPAQAPVIFPFLFITIACGAISGFHCLVSSGTSSKQLRCETDAQLVGYGAMLTEGYLAVLVILACAAGIGLGVAGPGGSVLVGQEAWAARYTTWASAGALGALVAAFVDGAANFLRALAVPPAVASALMGVMVASFASTTLDTACRLQRYVIQELARTVSSVVGTGVVRTGVVRTRVVRTRVVGSRRGASLVPRWLNPLGWLRNTHGATLTAVVLATLVAALPPAGNAIGFASALRGDVPGEVAAAALAAGASPERVAAMSAGGIVGAWAWLGAYAGRGGLILWPMFGATNQLLGGLSLLVIGFWLWRRRLPVWFVALPMLFMLVMPAWAMIHQLFVSNAGGQPGWVFQESPNWLLVVVATLTIALEVWMLLEAALLWPRVRGRLEAQLPALVA